jgi:hypothetical protein
MTKLSTKYILKSLLILGVLITLPGCDSINKFLKSIKPTSIERVNYSAMCKKHWKGKTIFIDFDTNYGIWYNHYASNLTENIKDNLIEGIVDDGCFHIQDRLTNAKYSYKAGVRIANPRIRTTSRGSITSISANFRIKTYDQRGNLITAKTRKVDYDSGMIKITINNSDEELVDNFAYNASVAIRKTVYESFK